VGSRGRIVVGSGRASIEVSPELNDCLNRILDGVAPRTMAVFDKEIGGHVQHLRTAWPKQSGATREGWQEEVRITSTSPLTIEGRVFNRVPYVYYERSDGKYGGTHYWTEYVLKPSKEIAKRMATELAADMAAMAGR
jgi:hypothetical protein